MPFVPSASCAHHALSPAVGICVRCRAAMCGECLTKLDGVNHCRACLEALALSPAGPPKPSLPPAAWPSLALGMLLLSLLAWLTLAAVLPGSSGP